MLQHVICLCIYILHTRKDIDIYDMYAYYIDIHIFMHIRILHIYIYKQIHIIYIYIYRYSIYILYYIHI